MDVNNMTPFSNITLTIQVLVREEYHAACHVTCASNVHAHMSGRIQGAGELQTTLNS